MKSNFREKIETFYFLCLGHKVLEKKSKQVEDMGKELELNRNKLDELNLSLAMNKSKHRNTQALLELANEEIKCLKECLKESLKSRNPDKQTIIELQDKVDDQVRDIEALRLELDVCKERND
uniref:Uncharacterized protein n=1 Tax=Rhodnius prolixus TaxID=13249 RepID=T1HIX1_RHOPR